MCKSVIRTQCESCMFVQCLNSVATSISNYNQFFCVCGSLGLWESFSQLQPELFHLCFISLFNSPQSI